VSAVDERVGIEKEKFFGVRHNGQISIEKSNFKLIVNKLIAL
jgi:hypothetical protein